MATVADTTNKKIQKARKLFLKHDAVINETTNLFYKKYPFKVVLDPSALIRLAKPAYSGKKACTSSEFNKLVDITSELDSILKELKKKKVFNYRRQGHIIRMVDVKIWESHDVQYYDEFTIYFPDIDGVLDFFKKFKKYHSCVSMVNMPKDYNHLTLLNDESRKDSNRTVIVRSDSLFYNKYRFSINFEFDEWTTPSFSDKKFIAVFLKNEVIPILDRILEIHDYNREHFMINNFAFDSLHPRVMGPVVVDILKKTVDTLIETKGASDGAKLDHILKEMIEYCQNVFNSLTDYSRIFKNSSVKKSMKEKIWMKNLRFNIYTSNDELSIMAIMGMFGDNCNIKIKEIRLV